jgi:hypothetical protein
MKRGKTKIYKSNINTRDDQLATSLSDKLAKKLSKTGMTSDQIKSALLGEYSEFCAAHPDSTVCANTKLGALAFVTRSEPTVPFSGISYTPGSGVSPAFPQVAQFGPQLIRVFVEALCDANGLHPLGMPSATACQPDYKLFDVTTECQKPGVALSPSLTAINMLATASEALTQTATGPLIRGANVASLNNEAVTQMPETLASVNARKITEKTLSIANSSGQCLPGTPVALLVSASDPAKAAAQPPAGAPQVGADKHKPSLAASN